MGVYSFFDVLATISGPGGVIPLGNEAGAAEEGITVAMREEQNTMTIGADGSGMHSLHAGQSGTVTVRLLKTSPINAALMAMYNFQRTSSANHGRNTIVVSDTARGDFISCQEVAFGKAPDLNYAKEAGLNEWVFHCVRIVDLLGTGLK